MTATHTNMNIAEYANEFIVAGGGIVAALTAYQQGKKSIRTSELDNVEKAVAIWRNLSEGLETKLKTVEEQGEECERARKQLLVDFDKHRAENDRQMKALEERQMRIAEAMANAFAAQGHKVNPKINLDLL
jgi:ABC-type branched-subunit amino acid transport system ATPase component